MNEYEHSTLQIYHEREELLIWFTVELLEKMQILAQLLDEHSFSKAFQTCLKIGLAPEDNHGLHDAQHSSINFCMIIG